jgi:transcriptional regulator with PAS, ATPase and Fis domain
VGALTESLLQSELFGYVAGAFTGAQKERKGIFEAAGKGTVFLDEFGDISPQLQVSLLRILEANEIRLIGGTTTRQIECKIVIASNVDLYQAVQDKKFREDLYFRLARFDIKLPPLRERPSDIPKLIEHFLENKYSDSKVQKISDRLLKTLSEYRWPGNIRELKNEVERLKILHSDKELFDLEDFDFSHLQGVVPNFTKIKEDRVEENFIELKPIKPIKDVEDDQITKIIQRGSKVIQRHEFIFNLFRKYKKLTRSQIMEVANVSPMTATNDLKTLCEAGIIEQKTPTKSVRSHYYILVEK